MEPSTWKTSLVMMYTIDPGGILYNLPLAGICSGVAGCGSRRERGGRIGTWPEPKEFAHASVVGRTTQVGNIERVDDDILTQYR